MGPEKENQDRTLVSSKVSNLWQCYRFQFSKGQEEFLLKVPVSDYIMQCSIKHILELFLQLAGYYDLSLRGKKSHNAIVHIV